jgi:hypothetical protein
MARGLRARERATIMANTMSAGLFRGQNRTAAESPREGGRFRRGLPRKRKKDGAYPFAHLSHASGGYQ